MGERYAFGRTHVKSKLTFLKYLIKLIAAVIIIFSSLFFYISYLYFSLPNPSNLKYNNPIITEFIKLKCDEECKINWVPLSEISIFVKQAVISAEDVRFFNHSGVDWKSLQTAVKINIKQRKISWGASTITMQLAKNLYLSPKKTIIRKLKEIILTYKIEKALSKNRILELYLNIVEWGPDIFGISNASNFYFNKKPIDIGPNEASLLAAILPNPNFIHGRKIPNRFMESGQMIFENLLLLHLPLPTANENNTLKCKLRLNEEEIFNVNYILANVFSNIANGIENGDASLYSKDELMNLLSENNQIFVNDLFSKIKTIRKLDPIKCNRDYKKNNLVKLQQEDLHGNKRIFWVSEQSSQNLHNLLLAAANNGIFLRINSAYRSPGYQIYVFLKQLRKNNYCLSLTANEVALPNESEHSCLDRQAIDFGNSDTNSRINETGPYFSWLNENASKYGFYLTYPKSNNSNMSFEPWHWAYNPHASSN